MADFSLHPIVSYTPAGLTLGFSTEEAVGSDGEGSIKKVKVSMKPSVFTMVEHKPGIARYSDFSRKAKNLDSYVTQPLPHKN